MSIDKPHPYRHVRKNGTVVMVTKEHRNRLYRRGDMPANYPVPALRSRKSFQYWRNLGEMCALNNFDIDVVHRLNRYR